MITRCRIDHYHQLKREQKMIKRILSLVSLVSLMGCTTIYPKITSDSFQACWRLCDKHKGLRSVQANITINSFGKLNREGEACNCNDLTQYFIIDYVED